MFLNFLQVPQSENKKHGRYDYNWSHSNAKQLQVLSLQQYFLIGRMEKPLMLS